MAIYKYRKFLSHDTHEIFDRAFEPGGEVPLSGIYRCSTCGFEMSSVAGGRFPESRTCNLHHPDWKSGSGETAWQLAIFARHRNT